MSLRCFFFSLKHWDAGTVARFWRSDRADIYSMNPLTLNFCVLTIARQDTRKCPGFEYPGVSKEHKQESLLKQNL